VERKSWDLRERGGKQRRDGHPVSKKAKRRGKNRGMAVKTFLKKSLNAWEAVEVERCRGMIKYLTGTTPRTVGILEGKRPIKKKPVLAWKILAATR